VRSASARRPRSNAGLHGRVLHELGEPPEDGRVCVRHDSMPKVENMTRPSAGTAEDIARPGLDPIPGPDQDGRVEVALDPAVVADELPAAVERDAPVEAD